MKRTVRDLIRNQWWEHGQFPAIKPETSLEEALETIDSFDAGAALVLEEGRVRGIFSERDFARHTLEMGSALDLSAPVSSIMSRRVVYVTEDYTAEECLAVMAQMKFRHLPVLRDDVPIALLSIGHVAAVLIEDREYLIGELVKYITGSPTLDEDRIEGCPVIRELQLS